MPRPYGRFYSALYTPLSRVPYHQLRFHQHLPRPHNRNAGLIPRPRLWPPSILADPAPVAALRARRRSSLLLLALPADDTHQNFQQHIADKLYRLADGGQRRSQVGGEGEVVEARDRHLALVRASAHLHP